MEIGFSGTRLGMSNAQKQAFIDLIHRLGIEVIAGRKVRLASEQELLSEGNDVSYR